MKNKKKKRLTKLEQATEDVIHNPSLKNQLRLGWLQFKNKWIV